MLRKLSQAAALAAMVSWMGVLQAADKPQPVADNQRKHYERPTDPSLYVGAETCKTCHEDIQEPRRIS